MKADTKANARLIAASPDLLEALEKVSSYAQTRNDFYGVVLMQVQCAIAKAKGTK